MIPSSLVTAARELGAALKPERFISNFIAYVYNPIDYAFGPHETYLRRFGKGKKRCLFLGMNPGPWGMAQTGVPFGEIDHVTHWMGIVGEVGSPQKTHPKKPVHGFACTRSEVSGRRLWGLMKKRFPAADDFFTDHFVANYCPLLFLDEGGRNITPNKLLREQREEIDSACNVHLQRTVEIIRPDYLVGIGGYAEKKLRILFKGDMPTLSILHPSPASPRANRGWEAEATKSLFESGVWSE